MLPQQEFWFVSVSVLSCSKYAAFMTHTAVHIAKWLGSKMIMMMGI